MSVQHDCPHCGHSLFATKKMTLNWFQVCLALLAAFVVFDVLKTALLGNHLGKLTVYVILAAIGLVGVIFAKGVHKRRFLVSSCTRCDYVHTEEITTHGEVES